MCYVWARLLYAIARKIIRSFVVRIILVWFSVVASQLKPAKCARGLHILFNRNTVVHIARDNPRESGTFVPKTRTSVMEFPIGVESFRESYRTRDGCSTGRLSATRTVVVRRLLFIYSVTRPKYFWKKTGRPVYETRRLDNSKRSSCRARAVYVCVCVGGVQ